MQTAGWTRFPIGCNKRIHDDLSRRVIGHCDTKLIPFLFVSDLFMSLWNNERRPDDKVKPNGPQSARDEASR